VLATVTLGTPDDRQMVDDLMGVTERAFMMHYNFPPYSVGECRRPAGPGRREIGHGMLAERAIFPLIPENEKFPYTIRIVTEVLESNGSSSMASVCAGSLALMDAGVPIASPVAGIAMGLVKEGDDVAILNDIMGLEDHLGDMDFKVAGTSAGITALQMDMKTSGISFEVMKQAMSQAKSGREFILQEMAKVIAEPREDLKPHAPRIQILRIPIDKIGELIGPGGKVVKDIIEKTGCKIDIEDDGSVYIASTEKTSMEKAIEMITARTAEAEMDKTYMGKVVRITTFGAFVEILPGKDGLVHISELDFGRVAKVEDICQEGDTLLVKVIGIDPISGKIRLSRKAALKDKETSTGQKIPPKRQQHTKTDYKWVPQQKEENKE
jgi:polyribonucleotide nucleotidyltransferase